MNMENGKPEVEVEIENPPAGNNGNQGKIGTPPTDNNTDQNNHGETGKRENGTETPAMPLIHQQ